MSEIAFFMNRQDTTEFVDWLITSFGVTFVDEWAYELPLSRLVGRGDIIETIFGLSHHRRFALIHQEWSPFDLVTRPVSPTDGSRSFHCLAQRYGGPSFDYIASRVDSTDDGTPFIVCGSFSDYPSYYVEWSSSVWVPRPAEMAAIWKMVLAYLRRNGIRTVCRERPFTGPYVLRNALTDYRSGAWLRSGSDHYDPRTTKKTSRSS